MNLRVEVRYCSHHPGRGLNSNLLFLNTFGPCSLVFGDLRELRLVVLMRRSAELEESGVIEVLLGGVESGERVIMAVRLLYLR